MTPPVARSIGCWVLNCSLFRMPTGLIGGRVRQLITCPTLSQIGTANCRRDAPSSTEVGQCQTHHWGSYIRCLSVDCHRIPHQCRCHANSNWCTYSYIYIYGRSCSYSRWAAALIDSRRWWFKEFGAHIGSTDLVVCPLLVVPLLKFEIACGDL